MCLGLCVSVRPPFHAILCHLLLTRESFAFRGRTHFSRFKFLQQANGCFQEVDKARVSRLIPTVSKNVRYALFVFGQGPGRALFEWEVKEIELSIAAARFIVLVQELVQRALSKTVVDQCCSEPLGCSGLGEDKADYLAGRSAGITA